VSSLLPVLRGAALKQWGPGADACLVVGWKWLIAAASVLVGAVVLGVLVHPSVGSGERCEGIGFGCTPERDLDTLLVVAVCAATALASVLATWRRARRGRPWSWTLAAGVSVTVLATVATVWSQLPRHRFSPGPLSAANSRWELVLADGRAAAPAGTPLGDVLRSLQRRGPLTCRDAYGRFTGARAVQWSNRGAGDAYTGYSDSSGLLTAASLQRWADRLRRRGEDVTLADPGGDRASVRRLQVGHFGTAANGVLYVRASFFTGKLEIAATTGCHRD
jgi:hypothetical protein